MTENLRLEPPFYLPEAVDQFIRPALGDLQANEIPISALESASALEALNRALKFSIERKGDDTRP
ncbi:MAG: hypothetical protein QOK24_2722 [Verrucomicrobiota bacterium]|jgi:hypothetical protein